MVLSLKTRRPVRVGKLTFTLRSVTRIMITVTEAGKQSCELTFANFRAEWREHTLTAQLNGASGTILTIPDDALTEKERAATPVEVQELVPA